ncbi:MAG: hypothetical protein JWN44_6140 [Myxococcales bacterium]|nr:hypothetical protein [Myxococcales bacterium]
MREHMNRDSAGRWRTLFCAASGILVLTGFGCAGVGFPDVSDGHDLSTAFGPPVISRIRDAGAVRLPQSGAWKGEPDGVAGPGELLVIEGDNFGRLPTVSIGGRATSIVARTDGGGIVARVPTGVPAGDVPVVVSQPKGRVQKSFPIRRFAVVAHGGQVYFLKVDRSGAQLVGKSLPVTGARLVRISGDGAAAYVIASRPDGDYLLAIDLCAAGGPRPALEKKLPHHGALLTTAMDASIAAVVGDGEITLVQTRDPRAPALFEPIDLPMGAKAPRAIELSPDGKLLAVLVGEGNRLVALDVESPPHSHVVTSVDLLPDQKLPLVRDLAFSSDGETLWVVSGDNEKSLPALQPTRLTAVRILAGSEPTAPIASAPAAATGGTGVTSPTGASGAIASTSSAPAPSRPAAAAASPPGTTRSGARLLSLWRTQSVPGAAAPLHIAVARGQPLASGTTIRMPPDKAAVFVTSVSNAMFKLADLKLETSAGAKVALNLWHPPQPGMLVRADINGGGGPMFTTAELPSAVDLTPDSQLLMTTSARVVPVPSTGGVVVDFGVTWAPIFASTITPTFLALDKLEPAELKPPFHLGDIRIQP